MEAFDHRVDIDGPDGGWLFRHGNDPLFATPMDPAELAQTTADAEHIAGMDPPTTLALVAYVERCEAELDIERLRFAEMHRSWVASVAERDALRAATFGPQVVVAVSRVLFDLGVREPHRTLPKAAAKRVLDAISDAES